MLFYIQDLPETTFVVV